MTALEIYIIQHYNSRSLKSILSQIQQYEQKMGERSEQANYQEILTYIGYLRERNLHPKTIINHLTTIKIYYRYLISIGKREDHPCENMVLKDQINKAIPIENLYNKQTLENIYETFTEELKEKEGKAKAIALRNQISVGLMIYQALTNKELIELKIENINLESATIKIRETKVPGRRGNKGREIALLSKQILNLYQYITEYRKELEGQNKGQNNEYLLLTEQGQKQWLGYPYRMLKKLDGNYTPLQIRQSVIANMLKENHDIRVVQEFAGHRNAGSTEAYKRTGLEELKSAIEKLHPLQ